MNKRHSPVYYMFRLQGTMELYFLNLSITEIGVLLI